MRVEVKAGTQIRAIAHTCGRITRTYHQCPSSGTRGTLHYHHHTRLLPKSEQRSTQYNVCIAIITMVLWLVRLCIRGRTLDVYGALVSNILYDIMLVALWSYSAVIQSSGDYSDPKHIALRPWYLDRGCAEASQNNRAGCRAAKASFGLAVFAA
jgi:hypothetical protein